MTNRMVDECLRYVGGIPATLQNFRFARCRILLRASRLRFSGSGFSTPERIWEKSRKIQKQIWESPCIFLAKYEKYLTELVLPSFRVCLKSDPKNGISGFGSEFPSDAKTCCSYLSGSASLAWSDVHALGRAPFK